jgi:transporter family-2 protein
MYTKHRNCIYTYIMSTSFHITPLRALLLTGLAGLLMAIQVRINGELGVQIESGLVAALLSYSSGFIILMGIVAFRKEYNKIPERFSKWSWWMCLPGLLGTTYVLSATIAQPHIGVALLSIVTVAGQTFGGLIVDRLGVGPLGKQRATLARFGSIGLALLAVILSYSGAAASLSTSAFLFLLVVLAAGSGVAMKFALNARIGVIANSTLLTTLLSFTVGCGALLLVTAAIGLSGNLHVTALPTDPWLYVGGVCGPAIVFLGILGAQRLTTLQVALTILVGQMSGALIIDGVLPGGPGISWGLIAGTLLTFYAVRLAKAAPKKRHTRPEALPDNA